MAPVPVVEALVVPVPALVIRRDPKVIGPGVPKRVAVRKDKTWSSG